MEETIMMLRKAERLLNEAADLIDSAMRMSGFEGRNPGDSDIIRRIASSREYGGSLHNIAEDMEYAGTEQPCWTQALISPKNQFPSDDDLLKDI